MEGTKKGTQIRAQTVKHKENTLICLKRKKEKNKKKSKLPEEEVHRSDKEILSSLGDAHADLSHRPLVVDYGGDETDLVEFFSICGSNSFN